MKKTSDILSPMVVVDSNKNFTLGTWRVEPGANRLERNGEYVALEPRVMELLVLLANRAGEVVSNEEIFNQIWKDVVVGDQSIYQAIARLRKALGDNANKPDYIATVPKKGYRLIARVEPLETDKPDTRNSGNKTRPPSIEPEGYAGTGQGKSPNTQRRFVTGLAILLGVVGLAAYYAFVDTSCMDRSTDIDSIAVLSFVNLSGNPKNEYFASGLAEELINAFATVKDLKVVSRTSSFAVDTEGDIREIGKELNVASILEGSVRRDGNRLRVTTKLVSTQDGYQIWSETYDRELGDVFAIEREIAEKVLKAIHIKLTGDVGSRLAVSSTTDLKAYDFYLLGRHYIRARTQESLEKAVSLFQDAIYLDENFAQAYSGLADAHLLLSQYGNLPFTDAEASAEQAIRRAVALDKNISEAHASSGLLKGMQGKYAEAETALRTAIQLAPSQSQAHKWLGLVLAYQGQVNEAHKYFESALKYDPLNVVGNVDYAYNMTLMGRYSQALEHLDFAIEHHPESATLYLAMSRVAARYGKYDISHQYAAKALHLEPENAYAMAVLASAYTNVELFDKAEEWINKAKGISSDGIPFLTLVQASLYLAKGEIGRAYDFAQHQLSIPSKKDPWLFFQPGWRNIEYAGVARLFMQDYRGAAQLLEQHLSRSRSLVLRAEDIVLLRNSLAYAYKNMGRHEEFRAEVVLSHSILRQARSKGWGSNQMAYDEVQLYSLMERPGNALAALEQAIAQGFAKYWWIQHDPVLSGLRNFRGYAGIIAGLQTSLRNMQQQIVQEETTLLPSD